MNFLYPILLVIHVLFSLALIIAVLLQSSKGEGLAGAFGGGGGLTGAVFGGRGAATFLSKATTILAVGFMVTSSSLLILLGVGSGGTVKSDVIEDLQQGGEDLFPPPATTVPGEAPIGEGAAPSEIFPEAQPPGDTTGN
ncbi:MAG: preprotein translocase subunit SecG [candidate division Zixibacteria bacterium]